jgi:hypothetical protein
VYKRQVLDHAINVGGVVGVVVGLEVVVLVVVSAYLPTASVRQNIRMGPFTLRLPLAVAELLITVLRLETCGDQTLSHVYVHSVSNTG